MLAAAPPAPRLAWAAGRGAGGSRTSIRSRRRSAAFGQHPLGQLAGGLDVGRVVQQHQGLQRRVGAGPARRCRPRGRARRRSPSPAAGRSASRRCTGCGDRGRRRGPARTSARSSHRRRPVPPRAPPAGTASPTARRAARTSSPLTASALVADDLGRQPSRGPRASSRFSGSRSRAAPASRATTAGRWREVTISRCIAFTSQPRARRTPSPASRAAPGGSAARPGRRSPRRVLTRPVPKIHLPERLTATRAVSGCAGSTSHCARPRRLPRRPGSGGSTAGRAGESLSRLSGRTGRGSA